MQGIYLYTLHLLLSKTIFRIAILWTVQMIRGAKQTSKQDGENVCVCSLAASPENKSACSLHVRKCINFLVGLFKTVTQIIHAHTCNWCMSSTAIYII